MEKLLNFSKIFTNTTRLKLVILCIKHERFDKMAKGNSPKKETKKAPKKSPKKKAPVKKTATATNP